MEELQYIVADHKNVIEPLLNTVDIFVCLLNRIR
jgi:hypothetical protein